MELERAYRLHALYRGNDPDWKERGGSMMHDSGALPHPYAPLGAVYLDDHRCRFTVWAPLAQQVTVHIVAPQDRVAPMQRDERGYFHATVEDVAPGSRYVYCIDDGKERPDPASRLQPDGVHQASQVVDPAFAWADAHWNGILLRDYVVYEVHVGTFTPDGTFDAIIPQLPQLKELGVTAIELMPAAAFPGERNWGYDGVYLFAIQQSYGGPDGLKRLVNACHQQGIAVVLDVVYNHLGPEGNYLWDYGPYFTDHYKTPWGSALNFDGAYSDEVRRFFIANALYWITEFHIDALRLDAVHAIYDFSADHILAEMARAVHKQAERLNRRVYLIAESDLNDARLIRPAALGGYQLDAQWSDDFHHAVHTLLTGERDGYYADFGMLGHLAQTLRNGYAYAGDYSAYRRRRHGNSPRGCAAQQFVVCTQNHDQIGNRAFGDRLAATLSFDALKFAAGLMIFSPFIPMLFMGEEYGEQAPFQYFTSHSDPDLIMGVSEGRKREFAAFAWQGEIPDPQAEATFQRSKLNHALRDQGWHRTLRDFYRELLRLRRSCPALAELNLDHMGVNTYEREGVIFVHRWSEGGADAACLLFNVRDTEATLVPPFPLGRWRKEFDSADERWSDPAHTDPKTQLPCELNADDWIVLTLAPKAVALFRSNG